MNALGKVIEFKTKVSVVLVEGFPEEKYIFTDLNELPDIVKKIRIAHNHQDEKPIWIDHRKGFDGKTKELFIAHLLPF